MVQIGVVGCILVHFGADWCSLLNVGLLYVGADWCSLERLSAVWCTLVQTWCSLEQLGALLCRLVQFGAIW